MKTKMKFIKKITALLLSSVMLLSAVSLTSCGEKSEAPKGMQEASNTKIVDYHLYVPSDWIVDLSEKAVAAYASETDPSSVSVMSWDIDDSEKTIDSWWEGNLTDLELIFSNFNLESEDNMILGTAAAKKYVYTANLGENSYKIMQVASIRAGMLYLVTYTSTAENYDSHTEDVTKILENFKFTY